MVFVIRYDLLFYATGIQMVLTNTFTNELTTWLKSNTDQMHVMGLFYYQNSRKWSNVIPVQFDTCAKLHRFHVLYI